MFACSGIVLETLLGFRVPWFVDVDVETRRTMFRLAHAHGALLGLMNAVLAASLRSGGALGLLHARRSSTLLAGSGAHAEAAVRTSTDRRRDIPAHPRRGEAAAASSRLQCTVDSRLVTRDRLMRARRREFARNVARQARAASVVSILARLLAHDWPGNVRELEHCLEGAAVLAPGEAIEAGDLPLPPRARTAPAADVALGRLTWAEMERRYVAAVLAEHDGNRSAAARAMGVARATLLRKIKELGLESVGRG